MESVMGIGNSEDTKVNGIKHDLCCEIGNHHKISIKSEARDSPSNNAEDLRLKDDSDDNLSINQSGDQPQNVNDDVQIKHEVNGDSDIEVDLAYRIIDTFNVCEVKTFNQEDEQISPDTTLFKIGLQNNQKQTQLKVEVDNKAYMDNNIDTFSFDKSKIACIKENVDYENQNSEDDVNKLHSKGM